MFDNRFAAFFHRLRKDYGLSQSKMGELLDMTKVQISYYERGLSYPSLELVQRVCQVFNIPFTQIASFTVRNNFFLRELVTSRTVQILHLSTSTGLESLTGNAGLIELPEALKKDDTQYLNFMLLKPTENSELAQYFQSNLIDLPEQPMGSITDFMYWTQSDPKVYRDGYPLLYRMYKEMNKGAWIGFPLARPATDENILLLQLPNKKIIRLYIQPDYLGAKLHATYCKELEAQVNQWFALDEKVRIKLAQAFCFDLMKTETQKEDYVADHCVNTDEYDFEYNLKKYLENRGTKINL